MAKEGKRTSETLSCETVACIRLFYDARKEKKKTRTSCLVAIAHLSASHQSGQLT
jgi:hypothetical protein